MPVEDFPPLRALLNLPIRTKLYALSGMLIVDLAAVIALGAFGMSQLSALRAFVGGEGLWAKAQKDAVNSLDRYALTHDEDDYREFLSRLAIPLGDHRARLALEKDPPDYAEADAGFIAGGNHPDDVRGMSLLFLRFRRVSYIRRAMELWRAADERIADLRGAAEELHARVASGRGAPAQTFRAARRIAAINERLTALEVDFSSTLGEASRWARRVLLAVMLLGSALVGALSLLLALLISRGISSGVGAVARAADLAARGDLAVRVPAAGGDELGRLAESFNAMVEGLAKLDKLKGDFVATVSHELRTPLTLALAPLETLLERRGELAAGEQRRLLLVAHNNAVRLLQMVNGLLDFSRLEAGRLEARCEPADAAALADSLVRDFKPIAANRGVALAMDGASTGVYARLDRYLFERILFNLLSNAVKFTPSGGRVGVWIEQKGDALSLTVKDTGIGIAAADRDRLFQRFRQVESSATRRYEGTGLGLALVKEFAGLHDGSVAVRSEPGRGSAFRVELGAPKCSRADLPGAPERHTPLPLPRAEAAAAASAPREDAGLPRVLIAEDNPDMAVYVAGLLRGLCATRVACDGRGALALAREWSPDLIVADVMMPDMDGLSLCRAVKADPALGATPVILLTALTDRDAMTRGWEAGADEYLFKPFHPREVTTRVRTLLDSVRARRRAAEELARKAADLERSNAELEQFAFVASHDLQAPLRKIAGFTELITREHASGLDAPTADLFSRVARATAQMQDLINALLRYSRVGRGGPAHAAVSARAVFDAAVANLEAAVAESGARVSCGELPTVTGDVVQLTQLFQNLIGNAVKFRAPGRAPTVRVEAARKGGAWEFCVRDDGIGLDMKFSDRVFGVFERLHAREAYPGSGIGLAICKKIAEGHGGRIWVESEPGRGAAFFFTLPAAAGAALEIPRRERL